jgi:L-asparagine oxygenase
MDPRVETYNETRPANIAIPYDVPVAYRLTDSERTEVSGLLDGTVSPYRDLTGFLAEVKARATSSTLSRLREVCADFKRHRLQDRPVLWLKNCPTGNVPVLDFEDPLASKHAIKAEFIAETFLDVMAELLGTTVITYRTANRGDFFHDIIPMKKLEFTITQKTVNTLHFHCDLPNNKVRPDWVYLLTLRNSPLNEVYTPIVRVRDVLEGLDEETKETLRQPLFYAPRPVVDGNISNYGRADGGRTDPAPLLVRDRGYELFAYHEGCTTSDVPAGQRALAAVDKLTHRLKHNVFLEERDFIAICNHTAMHARHVVNIVDMEAHRRRWLLKTWNVDDVKAHEAHMLPGLYYTADE